MFSRLDNRGPYRDAVIGLILIDVDGTLTGTGGAIDRAVWPALERARELGVHSAICTGRPGFALARDYAQRVEPNGFHIFQNGAAVQRTDGTLGLVSTLPGAAYRGMVEAARREATPLEVYTPTGVYLERTSNLTERHAQVIGLEPVIRDVLAVEGPVVRVQWVVPDADLPRFEAITAGFPDLELNTATQHDMPGVTFSSVTRRGTSKVSAARWLAEHHGLGLEQVAMVGDGDGDLETIRAVGLGIAMGNATDRVKAVARQVVGHVDEGGLAQAIGIALSGER